MVHEATRNRNFNTKITEWIGKDDGKSRVYYKTVRSINAGEEIGTKYSSDGTYWSNRVHIASANNLALSMKYSNDVDCRFNLVGKKIYDGKAILNKELELIREKVLSALNSNSTVVIVDISEEYTLTQPDIMSEDIKQSDIPSALRGEKK